MEHDAVVGLAADLLDHRPGLRPAADPHRGQLHTRQTYKQRRARWPSGAPSRPDGRWGLGVLRATQTTGRYSDKAHSGVCMSAKRRVILVASLASAQWEVPDGQGIVPEL